MTDEEKIALIKLLIGDTPNSPFFPLFQDQDLQKLLDMNGGDVYRTARFAAISACMQLAGWNSRERIGDIEMANQLSTNYVKALEMFIKNPDIAIPQGLVPWYGSKDSCSKLVNLYKDPCEEKRSCGGF